MYITLLKHMLINFIVASKFQTFLSLIPNSIKLCIRCLELIQLLSYWKTIMNSKISEQKMKPLMLGDELV